MTSWWGMGSPSQVALSWLVNVGGTAWDSDLPFLRSLERDGLAHHDADDDTWHATDKGRALFHERHHHVDPYPIPEETA